MDIRMLLKEIFGDSESGLREEKIDNITHKLNTWLCSGDIRSADETFQILSEDLYDEAMEHLDVLLTLLMATHGGRSRRLPHREKLIKALWERLTDKEGESRARAYLGNLYE